MAIVVVVVGAGDVSIEGVVVGVNSNVVCSVSEVVVGDGVDDASS